MNRSSGGRKTKTSSGSAGVKKGKKVKTSGPVGRSSGRIKIHK